MSDEIIDINLVSLLFLALLVHIHVKAVSVYLHYT